MTSLGL
jgi:hypothetical protein